MFSVMSVSLSVYLSTGGPHVTTYGPARGSERVHLELSSPHTHTGPGPHCSHGHPLAPVRQTSLNLFTMFTCSPYIGRLAFD